MCLMSLEIASAIQGIKRFSDESLHIAALDPPLEVDLTPGKEIKLVAKGPDVLFGTPNIKTVSITVFPNLLRAENGLPTDDILSIAISGIQILTGNDQQLVEDLLPTEQQEKANKQLKENQRRLKEWHTSLTTLP